MMATNEKERRLKILQLANARQLSHKERLEAKIEQLKRERDKLKALLAAIESNRPKKVET